MLPDDCAKNHPCRHGRVLCFGRAARCSVLRGEPVIVAWLGKRSSSALPYEVRSFGVRSAMPAVRAERLCPAAIFVPPDFTRYRAVSRSVREIFKRHTDLIEPLSLDEAYLKRT